MGMPTKRATTICQVIEDNMEVRDYGLLLMFLVIIGIFLDGFFCTMETIKFEHREGWRNNSMRINGAHERLPLYEYLFQPSAHKPRVTENPLREVERMNKIRKDRIAGAPSPHRRWRETVRLTLTEYKSKIDKVLGGQLMVARTTWVGDNTVYSQGSESPGYCLRVSHSFFADRTFFRHETPSSFLISVGIIEGEFDDMLTWPFPGKIVITLYDQYGYGQDYIRVHANTELKYCFFPRYGSCELLVISIKELQEKSYYLVEKDAINIGVEIVLG